MARAPGNPPLEEMEPSVLAHSCFHIAAALGGIGTAGVWHRDRDVNGVGGSGDLPRLQHRQEQIGLHCVEDSRSPAVRRHAQVL